MKFPYGISDFGKIMLGGYFYQDRSACIPLLEEAGDQLVFVRPRRFGKSLLLSMLEHYYDLNRAEQFEALFGGLAVGRNPTPLHNRYCVMRWDFSLVKSQGEVGEIEAALHRHLNDCVQEFALRYESHLAVPVSVHEDNALSSWRSALMAVAQSGHKLYLLIDEYDNFANEVLMARQGHYEALLYGEGLLKTVFKAVKAAASGQGLDRVFITGVSPVAMSDLTSGYNVARNIYLNDEFNDLCGFTEGEVAAVLDRLAAEGGGWSAKEALDTLRTFYDGYRFSENAADGLYNPTLSLYFFDALRRYGRYPKPMLDENLAMDRHKLVYVSGLPHGEDILIKALSGNEALTVPELAQRFGVEDMLKAVKDQTFMASLMYYFGVLTLGGQVGLDKTALKIPNLAARSLYVERLQDLFLPEYEDRQAIEAITDAFFLRGDLVPLCDFLEQRLFKVLSNRDYRWSNELLVKIAFMTLLFNDRVYMMVSETEVDHGYVDLSLIVRPDMRRFGALDLLLEFKYLGLRESGLTGEQVRAAAREDLAKLPAVAAKLAEAAEQVGRYGTALKARYGLAELRSFAVVALGFERVVFVRTE
jgi:hypothetical protein